MSFSRLDLSYDILEEICSHCIESSLTKVALCNTSLCNIARKHLYYYVDFSNMGMTGNDRVLKFTALHHLRFTYHLNLCGWLDEHIAGQLVALLDQITQYDHLRSCALRLYGDIPSLALPALSRVLNITTLQRLCIDVAVQPENSRELFIQALSTPSLRDISLIGSSPEGGQHEDILYRPSSVPRPPLDTIVMHYLHYRKALKWHQIKQAFDISQVTRVGLFLHVSRKREEEELVEIILPFLEDLPAAHVEGFAIRIVGNYDIEKSLGSLQSLRRFRNLQAISVHLDMEDNPTKDILNIVVVILSHLSPHMPLQSIHIFIERSRYGSVNDYVSGLDGHHSFIAIHDKFPNATLNLYLEKWGDPEDDLYPVHIAGVDNIVDWTDQGPFHNWETGRRITDECYFPNLPH